MEFYMPPVSTPMDLDVKRDFIEVAENRLRRDSGSVSCFCDWLGRDLLVPEWSTKLVVGNCSINSRILV
eukprot:scaffold360_cov374-Pavlova_lutheri.AAC.55